MLSNAELYGQLDVAITQIQLLLEKATALVGGSLSMQIVNLKRRGVEEGVPH
jgi:hypothetical protein